MKLFSKVIAGVSVFALCVVMGGAVEVSALRVTNVGNEPYAQDGSNPETPGNFRLVKRTGNKLQLNWDWVAGGTGRIHYELSYAGETLVLDQYYPGYTVDASNVDLSPGHTYIFSLRAVDELGARSIVPAQLVFETTPPSSPSDLAQLSTKLGYPDLISFELSTDAAGPIWGYEAFLNGVSFGIVHGVDDEFSLFDQLATSYLPHPTGAANLQLRALDSSFNTSPLSEPLVVIFPQ